MQVAFKPSLLSVRVSTRYINPGDTVYVTLLFQANGSAREDYRFFLDIEYGHQRRPENRQYDFIAHAEAFPPPTRWLKDSLTAVTIPWRNLSDWSGTYHIFTRIMSKQGQPVVFKGENGADTIRQYIGDVDVSWNLGRPWVAAHRHEDTVIFAEPNPGPVLRPVVSSVIIGHTLQVMVGQEQPAILGMRIDRETRTFTDASARLRIRNRSSGAEYTQDEAGIRVEYHVLKQDGQSAAYTADAYVDDIYAASCMILLSVSDRTLSISVSGILEQDGFELLRVEYPALAELQSGFLVDFFGAGRLISVQDATPLCHNKRYDVRNAAALYDERILLLVESTHMDSLLRTGISEVNAEKRGIIGGSIVLRVPAAKPGLAGIQVQTPPVFTVEAPALNGAKPDWKTAAALLRRGVVPGKGKALYDGAYVYKQLVTYGPVPGEAYRADKHPRTQNLFNTVSFVQTVKNVHGLYNLTDGLRQVVYLAGWQKGGFDTSFPEPYEAEERCGGTKALADALEAIRAYHALSGLHDNFDDIDASRFPDCPFTAMDEWGQPWRGWIWAGGMTHSIGFSKYVKSGAMSSRVRRMTTLLPLRDTYHIDVLTAEACRYDYDPAQPASAEDSFRAKLEIVAAFQEKGIDVTSEMLTHPAVGHIGYALHTRMDVYDVFIPGERFIPLVQMIYHDAIGYSAPSHTKEQMLWGLLTGAHTFHEEDVLGPLSVSRYYLQHVQAMLMNGKQMTDFEMSGTEARSRFGEDSCVEVDFATESYRVVWEGKLTGCNFTTFFRGPKGYLAYSMEGALDGYAVPEEWREGDTLRLTCLTPEGDGASWEIPCPKATLALTLPAMTPVRIICKEEAE
jgi:hypothetical protein